MNNEIINVSNSVIDTKTEHHKFFVPPWYSEVVDTRLTLVTMGSGKVGILYDSKFSGVKSGHVHGGPIEVKGNTVIKPDPRVTITISNFRKTDTYASMHIKIDVSAVISVTIFDQTLGGEITTNSGWKGTLDAVESNIESKKKLSKAVV
ncbi:hypothetical protein DMA11_13780 [Marinilabiliaceae bacterium JC017]|nr:hypothetical protein DMA11_13780 [Marinilabiliaceae bacterium JC017]